VDRSEPEAEISTARADRSLRRLRWAALTLSFGLLLLVAAAGPSAAKPGLGPRGWAPGSLPITLSSALVTAVLWTAYLLGAVAVALGLWRGSAWGHRSSGSRPGSGSELESGSDETESDLDSGSADAESESSESAKSRSGRSWPGRSALPWFWPLVLAALALATAPFGSADHINYAAYGRIMAQGGDPYVVAPITFAGGADPVTSAVEPPWTLTPSVYGPFATALQTVSSHLGGDNLRQTVWVWQLIVVGSWLLVTFLLRRAALENAARGRVDLLWTANPLIFGVAVLGAHVDLLATALALAAVVLAARRPWIAGLLLGAAVSTKITYAIVGLAILWSWRSLGRSCLVRKVVGLAASSLAVFVSLDLWAGPHVFGQLLKSANGISLATAWRPVVNLLSVVVPSGTARTVVSVASTVAVVVLAWALARLVRSAPITTQTLGTSPRAVASTGGVAPQTQQRQQTQQTRSAMTATFVLATAYALGAPYALPWYDALTWATLPLLLASSLDAILLARLTVMAMAYVPGRVVAMSSDVESLTLGFRKIVGPLSAWLVWLAIAHVARREWSRSSPAGSRSRVS
jgi:hypothetical protein